MRQFVVDVYGGRAASSTTAGLGFAGVARYDTWLTGFNLRRSSKTVDFSLAGNLFRGTRRRGTTLGAGYGGSYARNHFKVQGLVGYFSGFSLRPIPPSTDALLLLNLPASGAPQENAAALEAAPVVQPETEQVKAAVTG